MLDSAATSGSRSRTRGSSRSRCERSGARKETTIHVGDLYNVDVVGARNAGLRGVLLDEAGPAARRRLPARAVAAELVARISDGEFD